MLCGWYHVVLLEPVQPDESVLKPANDRHLQSTLSNTLSSDFKVYTCTFQIRIDLYFNMYC